MKVKIEPGTASGTLAAPPSKSFAHRALLCAALAQGTSVICGVADSQDILATLDCIEARGARYRRSGTTLTVWGGGIPAAVYPCRESGSTLRFFLPVALTCADTARFTGTPRLMERGVGIYTEVLRGVTFAPDAGGLTVRGHLRAGSYRLRGDVSSQFVTGLLFALPLLPGDSRIELLPPVESRPYLEITLEVLRRFGICVEQAGENVFSIPGSQHYCAASYAVEGDWSNAAFLYCLNFLGGDIAVTGLRADSAQGDRVCLSLFDRLRAPGAVIELSACPDLGPVLFAAAAARHGAVFTGTRRLRIKESDRASAMAQELAKLGIAVQVEENRVTVSPGTLRRPLVPLCGHNDHRIVMALSMLASVVGAEITGAEAVAKSWPDFFDRLEGLGLEVQCGI